MCHFSRQRLIQTADSPEEAEAVWVDQRAFLMARHPFQCVVCHGGVSPASGKEMAHEGLIEDPGAPEVLGQSCGQEKCHPEIAETYPTSLHATVQGLKNGAYEVLPPEEAERVVSGRCNTCHAGCSDCHLAEGDGNLRVASHDFSATNGSDVCIRCHQETGTGFEGAEGFFGPSVHASAGLECTDCHRGSEVHGTGEALSNLRQAIAISCTDCHRQPGTVVRGLEVPQYQTGGENVSHALHEESLDCTACHIEWNYNCYGCHGYDEAAQPKGYQSFDTEVHLAVDPAKDKVATVVHAPMSRTVGGREYAYGAWAFKNRHALQVAPRSCEECHADGSIFIDSRWRRAPFVGTFSGAEFVADETVDAIRVSREAALALAAWFMPERDQATAQAAQVSLDGVEEGDHVAVRWALWFYRVLIPLVIGGFILLIVLDVRRRSLHRREGRAS
ncbi:cytochrome c3 family protein [Limnochorda pilosa]|uniref:Tetrahaem cytochrome domain-containing protein n=1 Tax=Limnochorda pilosa TaxID=1555112 RepID=A0A0K2SGK8_LIMPI|nr:cytochrome c3 family protein [Limnochorda pilosa]BAS26225.1 hypothetical protein LIP_0368 [Limnochorda pilosa]